MLSIFVGCEGNAGFCIQRWIVPPASGANREMAEQRNRSLSRSKMLRKRRPVPMLQAMMLTASRIRLAALSLALLSFAATALIAARFPAEGAKAGGS